MLEFHETKNESEQGMPKKVTLADRENQTHRHFHRVAEAIYAECKVARSVDDVLDVLLALDFVGTSGPRGYGGFKRGTGRAFPCKGVLGSGKWRSFDALMWWQALVAMIEHRARKIRLSAEIVKDVLGTGLVNPGHAIALGARVRMYLGTGSGINQSIVPDSGTYRMPEIAQVGLQQEEFGDHFHTDDESRKWASVVSQASTSEPMHAIEMHPKEIPAGYSAGTIVYYDESARTISRIGDIDAKAMWLIRSYDAPLQNSGIKWV